MPVSASKVILSEVARSKVPENKSLLSVSNELELAGPKTAQLPPPKPGPPGSATNGITWPLVGPFYPSPPNNF